MSQMEVLLVHLKTKPPRHLIRNLQYLRESFPQLGITLASDLDRRDLALPSGVDYFHVPQGGTVSKLLSASSLSGRFREGFWPLTLARLGALEDWHLEHPGRSLLHLESDMLLMEYAPVETISKLETLTWLTCSPDADLAGFVFSPDSDSTSLLLKEAIAELERDPLVNDMEIMYRVRKRLVDQVVTLPGLDYLYTLGAGTSPSPGEIEGIFDSLSIGMWLAGEDPRNFFGLVRYLNRNPENAFLARPVDFHFFLDGGVLFVAYGEKSWPVYSLHVHSKDLSLFSKESREAKLSRVIRRQSDGEFRRFAPYGFWMVLKDYSKALIRRVFKF